ncbi:MFS transporter [Effusibacillus lacus]|uniref:MFS transporter n=1 Tax=Effusibacillus lacus TaxID=1348429 RepID=A0A292YCK1_9BACL|nr:MFS transporter [Effusibacillus lacus]TCS72833.1 UMF1 family MFS transporter [Effusibacillus lacus]GAX89242.1 MFS transporter [Effusibacillus lacus]
MDQKAVRGWVMYDWANSAFVTTMIAAVLPIFYSEVAAGNLDKTTATSYWGFTQSIGMLIVAVMAPVLGAIADMSGSKIRFLRLFAYTGMIASVLMIFVGKGDYLLASLLVVFGIIGYTGGNVFYDSLLPDLVPYEKRDYISSKGYAFGYLGGGLLLTINLAMIMKHELFGIPDTTTATYLSFASVGIWWFVFSLPLFRHVKSRPAQTGLTVSQYARTGFTRIWNTLREILKYRELIKFLIAFWFFNDAINTIITMAAIYGKEIGIGTTDLITALLITQFVGIPFTLLFGKIAERVGSKPSLYISLSTYVLISVLGFFMQNSLHFYLLAMMVGLVQGGSQAVARSIYSSLVPPSRSAEFFGFLSLSSKFASVLGPLVFGLIALFTDSSRWGILSLVLFFGIGILVLTKVDLVKGREEALG